MSAISFMSIKIQETNSLQKEDLQIETENIKEMNLNSKSEKNTIIRLIIWITLNKVRDKLQNLITITIIIITILHTITGIRKGVKVVAEVEVILEKREVIILVIKKEKIDLEVGVLDNFFYFIYHFNYVNQL